MDGWPTCERCGNAYDKPLVIRHYEDQRELIFDSFECAIDALAPKCGRCGIRIVGHGVEQDGRTFCSASCARMAGSGEGLADRADATGSTTTAEEDGTSGRVGSPTRPPSDS